MGAGVSRCCGSGKSSGCKIVGVFEDDVVMASTPPLSFVSMMFADIGAGAGFAAEAAFNVDVGVDVDAGVVDVGVIIEISVAIT